MGLDFDMMALRAYENSRAKGFWSGPEQDNFPTKIALIHSEVDEAAELFILAEPSGFRSLSHSSYTSEGKPVGFDSELADVLIRIGDVAGRYGMSLGRLIEAYFEEGIDTIDSSLRSMRTEEAIAFLAQMHIGVSKALERYRDPDCVLGVPDRGRPANSTVEGGLSFAASAVYLLARRLDIDLDRAVAEKMAFNAKRPALHGKRV